MKLGLFFQNISFRTEFPGSKFLLPNFFTGGKWDFQVANLLLATVNFKPCKYVKQSCVTELLKEVFPSKTISRSRSILQDKARSLRLF